MCFCTPVLVFLILCALTAINPSGIALAQSDFQWTLNDLGTTAWTINSASDVSSSSLHAGPFPASNPAINLQVGKRYEVTIVNALAHPFQILAKSSDFTGDIVLLSNGASATEGNFENDPAVGWTDDGAATNAKVAFTLTQTLLDAMRNGTGGVDRNPGYRCGIHINTMRGDFAVTAPAPAAAANWVTYQ